MKNLKNWLLCGENMNNHEVESFLGQSVFVSIIFVKNLLASDPDPTLITFSLGPSREIFHQNSR